MSEPAVAAIARLVPAILRALHALEFTGRHLSPTTLPELVEAVAGRDSELADALAESQNLAWPDNLAPARACLEGAAEAAHAGLTGLQEAPQEAQPIVAAYRALRNYARGAEALYPMAPYIKSVSQFFLEEAARTDNALIDRLATADPSIPDRGVMHVGGKSGTRGAFSLYVPENHDAARPCPLVVALHGGSGNGGAFIWSWLREARTRGLILLAPTARGSTWSLMDPETDGANIDGMIGEIAVRWAIDPSRCLLTGMSDGGTFSYVLGLGDRQRFTHLAPVAAAFHPLLLSLVGTERVKGLPIHIVHGAQDWMFPAQTAEIARRTLEAAGARVLYREIADLSHTYPRDENGAILDWFLGDPQ